MNHNQKRLSFGVTRGIPALGLISALLYAAPAFANPVTFETLAPAAHESGTSISASGINMAFIEGPVAAFYGAVSGIGTVINSNDPSSCDITGCPAGATGNYLGVFNDGAVKFTNANAGSLKLDGLDFAFISPAPVLDGVYGQLQITGMLWDGSVVSTALNFPGQNNAGAFMFGAAALDDSFRSLVFKSLTFNACMFDFQMVCNNSFDNPAFNQAQFAIDNIAFGDVPEPASFLLVGLGIGALGLARRRHARKAASSVTPVSVTL
jgi:hypothetical protein